MKHNALGLVAHTAVALIGVVAACATGGAQPAPATPAMPAAAPVTAIVPIQTRAPITAQAARTQVVAAGRSWAQFLAQTSVRDTYDSDFVDAWLGQPNLVDTPRCRYVVGAGTSAPC